MPGRLEVVEGVVYREGPFGDLVYVVDGLQAALATFEGKRVSIIVEEVVDE